MPSQRLTHFRRLHTVQVCRFKYILSCPADFFLAGGTKKIENKKLEWKAEPKVSSFSNIKYKPRSREIKVYYMIWSYCNCNVILKQIFDEKLDIQVSSRVGSLENLNYRPKREEKKIFDDKESMKRMGKKGSLQKSVSSTFLSQVAPGSEKVPTHKKVTWL